MIVRTRGVWGTIAVLPKSQGLSIRGSNRRARVFLNNEPRANHSS